MLGSVFRGPIKAWTRLSLRGIEKKSEPITCYPPQRKRRERVRGERMREGERERVGLGVAMQCKLLKSISRDSWFAVKYDRAVEGAGNFISAFALNEPMNYVRQC